MNHLKKELYQQCQAYVQRSIEAAQQAIEDAQNASDDDTKSSAGDKYETGRAMMEQETDRNMAQLKEANKLKIILNKINPEALFEEALPGSLVITDNGNFYIAIGAGVLTINNENYFSISAASPIGLKLKGLKEGQNFKLMDKHYLIKRIF